MGLQAVPNTEEKNPVIFFFKDSISVLPVIAGENHKIRANSFTIKTTQAQEGSPELLSSAHIHLLESPALQLFQTCQIISYSSSPNSLGLNTLVDDLCSNIPRNRDQYDVS